MVHKIQPPPHVTPKSNTYTHTHTHTKDQPTNHIHGDGAQTKTKQIMCRLVRVMVFFWIPIQKCTKKKSQKRKLQTHDVPLKAEGANAAVLPKRDAKRIVFIVVYICVVQQQGRLKMKRVVAFIYFLLLRPSCVGVVELERSRVGPANRAHAMEYSYSLPK